MSDSIYKKILDESNQMIQLADLETYEMLYANKPAMEYTGHANTPFLGAKCYKYMMGLEAQCPFCPMLARTDDVSNYETEVDNGVQVYKVKTVITEWEGRPAFIEYATDVTLARRAQEIYSSDMKRLLDSIPEARGIYHLNLTKNSVKCLRTETVGSDGDAIDSLIQSIGALIASSRDEERFESRFNREKLIEAFEAGRQDTSLDVICSGGENSNHWVRITARNIVNPATGDLECFLYVNDISNEKNLEELAARDALTGLFNKKYYEKTVRSRMERNVQNRAAIFMDIDHFKQVNDTFGHLVGDMVITSVGNKLQGVFSEMDTIARFGGDEYCIYLENIPEERLMEKLEHFRLSIASAGENPQESGVVFTCSIGVAYAVDGKMNDYAAFMEAADRALYRSKEEGRNRITMTRF